MYFNLYFYMYVFVILLNITCIFCFSLIHYLNHKKWIEEMRENLYVQRIYDLSSKIEYHLKDIVAAYRGENPLYI
jgi:hypothetical protein